MEIHNIVGNQILITGDVNTGKTILTRKVMDLLCSSGLSSRMAIIDMAPDIPEEVVLQRGLKGVGGKLIPAGWEQVIYLTAPIRPPRLSSRTEEEALVIAGENKTKIDNLLNRFQQSGRDILFINDLSMYLQAGDARELLQQIQGTSTVIANGYYGQKLGTGILSAREAKEMEVLITSFPYHYMMPESSLNDILTIGSSGRK